MATIGGAWGEADSELRSMRHEQEGIFGNKICNSGRKVNYGVKVDVLDVEEVRRGE
jgi:hypothetical protein